MQQIRVLSYYIDIHSLKQNAFLLILLDLIKYTTLLCSIDVLLAVFTTYRNSKDSCPWTMGEESVIKDRRWPQEKRMLF
jgi:hypothetical protein